MEGFCLRTHVAARFWPKATLIVPHPTLEKPCRLWTGAQSRGGNRPKSGPYGSIKIPGMNSVRAHIVAAWLAGMIEGLRMPDGLHLDHQCRNTGIGHGSTLCVEEAHLELVTEAENHRRRWARAA